MRDSLRLLKVPFVSPTRCLYLNWPNCTLIDFKLELSFSASIVVCFCSCLDFNEERKFLICWLFCFLFYQLIRFEEELNSSQESLLKDQLSTLEDQTDILGGFRISKNLAIINSCLPQLIIIRSYCFWYTICFWVLLKLLNSYFYCEIASCF